MADEQHTSGYADNSFGQQQMSNESVADQMEAAAIDDSSQPNESSSQEAKGFTENESVKEWLKKNRRIFADYSGEGSSFYHPTYNNYFFQSIAAHFNDPRFNPPSIFNQIWGQVNRMAPYYSVFLDGGNEELLDMVAEFKPNSAIWGNLKPLYRIVEHALKVALVVVNSEDLKVVYGDEKLLRTSNPIVLLFDSDLGVYRGTQKVHLETWLNSHGRTQEVKSVEWERISHQSYHNCFLKALATHYNDPVVDPPSILKQISSHVREKVVNYSDFFNKEPEGFLTQIEQFERSGNHAEIQYHLEVVVRIIGEVLKKNIVIVDPNAYVIYGNLDEPTTSDTIILIQRLSGSYSGTQLIEHYSGLS